MAGTSKELNYYLADFERFEKNGGAHGSSWVRQTRQAALARFAALGFPTIRHEEWKYTSVAPLARVRFERVTDQHNTLTGPLLDSVSLAGVASAQLVFVNGSYAPELSSVRTLPPSVQVGSLATALQTDPARVEPHLARYAAYQDQSFVALNTAFLEDGAFIFVPRDVVVQDPIHCVFLSTTSGQSIVSHPRNLIVVENSSQVAIVESYLGVQQEVYWTNAVSEVVAGENSTVAHYKLEHESEAAFHIATIQARLGADCTFSSQTLSFGGALMRNDVNVELAGQGGDCTLDGLYLATAQQHVDNHTRIDHLQPHCRSRELYKGILDGKARGVFNGKVYVHKDAQKTDARQANKNLLLSEDAVINTKPQLEIYADDVKCTHGATIGQMDEDALFYLRSRGIDLDAARDLLTYAFASEMIDRIPIAPLRERLGQYVMTPV